MRIGIVGSGNMARALGGQWARAGHEIRIGGRDALVTDALVAGLGPRVRAASLAGAADFGQVVLLAVRRTGALSVLDGIGAAQGALAGRVLIDCTNPIDESDRFRLVTSDGPSMAMQVAAAAPGAQVVKAFNLGSADLWTMTPPSYHGDPIVVPISAATTRAADITARLVEDLGCIPLRWGGLDRAGQIEAVAAFGIRLIVEGLRFDAVMPSVQPGPPPGS